METAEDLSERPRLLREYARQNRGETGNVRKSMMVWHLKQNRALHERLFVLTVKIESVPWTRPAKRLTVNASHLTFGVQALDLALWSDRTSPPS
jgi:K+ transporter